MQTRDLVALFCALADSQGCAVGVTGEWFPIAIISTSNVVETLDSHRSCFCYFDVVAVSLQSPSNQLLVGVVQTSDVKMPQKVNCGVVLPRMRAGDVG